MPDASSKQRVLNVVVQRQLDVITTGNGAYLEMFLRAAKRADLGIRIVFSPQRSFGNRPWAGFHDRFDQLADEVVWPQSAKIGNYYWSLSPIVWMRLLRRLFKEGLRKLGVPLEVYSFLSDPLSQRELTTVAAVCDAHPADITIAEYSSLGTVLKSLKVPTIKGVLLHDLFSDRATRFRENGRTPDFYEVTREEEADWVAAAEFCIYASANEIERFSPLLPQAKALWLRPEPPDYETVEVAGEPRVVFLGTQHAGNEDALNHFIDDIWPRVLERKPGTAFWIAGSIGRVLSADRARTPGVQVLGRVDNLPDIGGENSVAVAPTRLATGVSIKLVEYMILGMPCVAYPLALEGFGTVLDDLCAQASDPESFADAVVALLDDPETRRYHSVNSRRQARLRLANDEVVSYLHGVAAAGSERMTSSAPPPDLDSHRAALSSIGNKPAGIASDSSSL